MKEKIATLTAAAALGLGGWFANNCEYQWSGTKLDTPAVSHGRQLNGQSSKGEQGLDPRTPEMVSRINAAIALLEACPDPAAKEVAAKFIILNSEAKIAMAYGNEIGKNALGVIIVASDKDNLVPQIGIAPQSLLDTQLSDQEAGKQMFKAVYIYKAVENSAAKYDQDQDFRNLINNQAEQRALEAFCAK